MPFIFTPPTYKRTGYDSAWHRRTSINVGVALIKRGTSYTKTFEPDAEDYESSDMVYLGGRSYLVDDIEASLLSESGYGEYLVSVYVVPYPSGDIYPGVALYPNRKAVNPQFVTLIYPSDDLFPNSTLYPQER